MKDTYTPSVVPTPPIPVIKESLPHAVPASVTNSTEPAAPVEQPAPETPVQEAPEAEEAGSPSPKDDPKLAARFAALARKERALLHKEREAKAHADDLERYRLARTSAKQKPLEAVAALGISLDDIVQAALAEGRGASPERRIDLMEQHLEEEKRARAEAEQRQQQAAQQQAIAGFKAHIGRVIEANKGDYELLAAQGLFAVEAVFGEMDREYRETGRVMDVGEAAVRLEQLLEEHALMLARSPKLAAKLAPKTTPTETKTLTNTVTPATVPTSPNRLLSKEEALARSAALLKFRK